MGGGIFVKAKLANIGTGFDEAPPHRLLGDNLSIAAGVRCSGDIVGKLGQIGRAAYLGKLIFLLQFIRQREEINWLMPLVKTHHCPKDRRVTLIIKVFCTNVLASIGQDFFVDKYRTK